MKRIITLLTLLCVCLMIQAQATTLTVDCQNPGWLSNKIAYGDQVTVENLKVTGYINQTDLFFIGDLIHKRNLKGKIDLYDANIIGENGQDDNTLYEKFLGKYESWQDSIRTLIFPHTLEFGKYSMSAYADTVVFATAKKSTLDFRFNTHNLILGEGLETIENDLGQSCLRCDEASAESIHLPTTVKKISDTAFRDKLKNPSNVNYDALENIEYLGDEAFYSKNDKVSVLPDTLRFPKLKIFQAGALPFRGNKPVHIFFGDNLEEITDSRGHSVNVKYLNFHFTKFMSKRGPCDKPEVTIYIPKGMKKEFEYYWRKAKIIEEKIALQTVELDIHSLKMEKNEEFQLTAKVYPVDADDAEITWSSSNSNVKVSNTGLVTAKKEGDAIVYAKSADGSISDSCKVQVISHVTGLRIEPSTLSFDKLGASFKLKAVVSPSNATNTSVTWACPTPSVCTVFEDGTVIATGNGTAVVMATSNDGHIPASCIVTVDTTTSGIDTMTAEDMQDAKIYTLEGRQIQQLQRGVNVLKRKDGTVKKIIVR